MSKGRSGKLAVVGLASMALCGGALLQGGCSAGADGQDEPHGAAIDDGKGDSSRQATFLNFEFDGQITANSSSNPDAQIRRQMLYTIGHLDGDRSVGRLDRLVLSNIKSSTSGGKTSIKYHALLPVAWGKLDAVPSSYELTMPIDVDGFAAFTANYKDSCVEHGAHDVDQGSMWYYFRPTLAGCDLAADDVMKTTATVTVSKNITSDKYPEYDKVWEDGALRVVSIFGKYESGATSDYDAGISAYNEFVAAVKTSLGAVSVKTTPADFKVDPGVSAPDITFEATLADGKKVVINALLVDEVAAAGQTFYDRYESLSASADLIAYNGHAGLGQNVRALSSHGKFVAGKYVIVFMNGCDTYAYVDGSLAQVRAALNPDDPTGTKYLDFVVNAMPAYFSSDSEASMAIINALLSYNAPLNYGQIFDRIDTSQVVLVTGEEDNSFTPGAAPPADWSLDEIGTLKKSETKKFTSPTLPAGTYVVQLAGTGDADLYVRRGADPTTRTYDCRPYKDGSDERCEVKLTAPATLNIMVKGYAPTSDFHVTGVKK